MRSRLSQLRSSQQSNGEPAAALASAFEELQASVNELAQADDELRRQNQELLAARGALEAERRRYRDLFEYAPDGYLVTDLEGQILEANRAAAALLQVRQEFLAGKPLTTFVAKESRTSFREQLVRLRQSPPLDWGYAWEVRLRPRNDLGCFDAAVTVSTVLDQQGQPCGLRWQLRDISVRKKIEAEIRRLNDELEQRVIARTAQLQEADRRKDEFLAMLAHELRNPLGAISTASQLLQMSDGEEDNRWVTDVINEQVGQLVRLIDDLLDVSRITRGKIELRKQPVLVADAIVHSVQTVQSMVTEREHVLITKIEPESLMVEADPARLEQILVNLLTNAVKYTPPGGQIEVAAWGNDNEVLLQVRDNGIGIVPELMPRIFDLFTQADNSLARSGGGLGIGLTLVRSLVELHGGTVSVSSAGPNQGSEFTVRLPVGERVDVEGPPVETDLPREAPGGRILVVDDNVRLARGLARFLEKSGYDVQTVHDGAEGLEAARMLRPKAVVLDIGLPGITGYEIAEQLRADPATSEMLLIAVSGYGRPQDVEHSHHSGFDHHLVKPVDCELLLSLLARAATEGRTTAWRG